MNKLIDAEKLKAEINGIIAAVKVKKHPDEFGSIEQCMAAAEIEALNLALDCIKKLQQEQARLSNNLDDAALKAYPKMPRLSEPHGVIPADNKTHYLGDANEENRIAFKAGARWMSEQGVTVNGSIEEISDGTYKTIDIFAQELDDVWTDGDCDVIIQIRKR